MFEPIKTNEKQEEKKKRYDPEQYRIRHTDKIGVPDVVLYMNGKIIATRKNVFAITGKAKAGKTYLLSLILKAVLEKGESNVFSSFLPKEKDNILFFDTEQSDFHIHIILNRIAKMGVEDKMPKLLSYSTRVMRKEDRRAFIEQMILETPNIGLVVIDGIADLIQGVNNEDAAETMFEDLSIWSVKADVSIGFVLHQNPSDSSKMRGHLGTIATNKCETALQVASDKDIDSIKIVDTTASRNAKPEPFSFEISEDGTPVIMNELYVAPSEKKRTVQLTDVDRYGILIEVFVGYDVTGLSYGIMKENIRFSYVEKYGAVGENKINDLIKYCKEKNWLVMPDGPKTNYHLYPFKD